MTPGWSEPAPTLGQRLRSRTQLGQSHTLDSGLFGEGRIRLDWAGVDGLPGLLPQLLLKGRLIGKGYGVGAVVQITAEVTAWDIVNAYAFIGAAEPRAYVLNWVKQRFAQPSPHPDDETTWDVELKLPMPPSIIEGLAKTDDRAGTSHFNSTSRFCSLTAASLSGRGPRRTTQRFRREQLRTGSGSRTRSGRQCWSAGAGVSGFQC